MHPSRPLGLLLTLALVPATGLAAPATAHAAAATMPPGVVAPAPAPAVLSVTLQCERCEEGPTLSLLWRSDDPAEPLVLRSVTTTDWAAGEFVLNREDGEVALRGQAVDGGWALQVPVDERGLPFRIVAGRSGFVADRAAWWPAQDGASIHVRLAPLADVLDAHPAWDPARTSECEMLVPKGAELPLVFLADGQPRAWLFPTPGATDATRWTFQFVRPGASLLERLSVEVTAFDEGDSWAVRAPLAGVSASEPGKSAPAAGAAGVSGDAPASIDPAPERPMTVAGVGALSLADCPRLPR